MFSLALNAPLPADLPPRWQLRFTLPAIPARCWRQAPSKLPGRGAGRYSPWVTTAADRP